MSPHYQFTGWRNLLLGHNLRSLAFAMEAFLFSLSPPSLARSLAYFYDRRPFRPLIELLRYCAPPPLASIPPTRARVRTSLCKISPLGLKPFACLGFFSLSHFSCRGRGFQMRKKGETVMLPRAEQKFVLLCQMCDFVSPTKSPIFNHSPISFRQCAKRALDRYLQ